MVSPSDCASRDRPECTLRPLRAGINTLPSSSACPCRQRICTRKRQPAPPRSGDRYRTYNMHGQIPSRLIAGESLQGTGIPRYGGLRTGYHGCLQALRTRPRGKQILRSLPPGAQLPLRASHGAGHGQCAVRTPAPDRTREMRKEGGPDPAGRSMSAG
jgi:hypothetical protein